MAQHPDCWGALDFVDEKFQPVKRVLIIDGNGMEKPPATKKPKAYVTFKGDPRKCFFGNKEMLKIANALRSLEMDSWRGAAVQITCGPKKDPEGRKAENGEPATVLGMVVLGAKFAEQRQQPATQKDIPGDAREP
jgi:hypothetical protein